MSLLYAGNLMSPPEDKGTTAAPGAQRGIGSCNWWSVDMGNNTDQNCMASSMRLATGTALSEATSRAELCMKEGAVSCVLSHEVGFPIPAVFYWDSNRSKTVALMNPSRHIDFEATQPRLRVRVGHPLDDVALVGDEDWDTYVFRKRVKLSAVEATAHTSSLWAQTTVYEDEVAMCVQLLNYTLPYECTDEGV